MFQIFLTWFLRIPN